MYNNINKKRLYNTIMENVAVSIKEALHTNDIHICNDNRTDEEILSLVKPNYIEYTDDGDTLINMEKFCNRNYKGQPSEIINQIVKEVIKYGKLECNEWRGDTWEYNFVFKPETFLLKSMDYFGFSISFDVDFSVNDTINQSELGYIDDYGHSEFSDREVTTEDMVSYEIRNVRITNFDETYLMVNAPAMIELIKNEFDKTKGLEEYVQYYNDEVLSY